MPTGVEVIVEDGFATVTPEPAHRGRVLTALLAAVDEPSQIRTDTSGRRRSYVVLEHDAREAGLLDEPAEENTPPMNPFSAKREESKIEGPEEPKIEESEAVKLEEPKGEEAPVPDPEPVPDIALVEEAPKAPAKKTTARKTPAKRTAPTTTEA
ncbi:hypothetical protein LRS71_09405 [Rhodococcus pyridinivorans]|uniref:hypothetical protein n=1 Tax=Rhodococcus pyridinivorans TaxID=103816 RepID=UPI001E5BA167|nr:hypothetical protein [Rhodococcus pyridinivorans]MCD5419769.1 hypothetical protein [Rhodococcus pyridinivorans]